MPKLAFTFVEDFGGSGYASSLTICRVGTEDLPLEVFFSRNTYQHFIKENKCSKICCWQGSPNLFRTCVWSVQCFAPKYDCFRGACWTTMTTTTTICKQCLLGTNHTKIKTDAHQNQTPYPHGSQLLFQGDSGANCKYNQMSPEQQELLFSLSLVSWIILSWLDSYFRRPTFSAASSLGGTCRFSLIDLFCFNVSKKSRLVIQSVSTTWRLSPGQWDIQCGEHQTAWHWNGIHVTQRKGLIYQSAKPQLEPDWGLAKTRAFSAQSGDRARSQGRACFAVQTVQQWSP